MLTKPQRCLEDAAMPHLRPIAEPTGPPEERGVEAGRLAHQQVLDRTEDLRRAGVPKAASSMATASTRLQRPEGAATWVVNRLMGPRVDWRIFLAQSRDVGGRAGIGRTLHGPMPCLNRLMPIFLGTYTVPGEAFESGLTHLKALAERP